MAESSFEVLRPAEAENLNMACFAITRALDAAPPANLAVELVLQGAVDHGLTAYLIAHKPDLRPANTVTLGIALLTIGTITGFMWWAFRGKPLPLAKVILTMGVWVV